MRRLFLATLLLQTAPAFPDDGLGNAYYLCDVFEKTGVSTECKASNATSTVDVIINTDAVEAGNVCAVIANNMAQKGRLFGSKWQLRIFAPDRADEPLAACALR
ncbi:MAG: hypothetical protein OEW88_10915 [Gammaproteobacteria bacterium]|nr:hypothetical protein [Gammaproteobacteria bacterium]MDH5276923.1 hypothetical protein [Gammaproteobacteria bacterium]